MAILFDEGNRDSVTKSDRVLHTPSTFARETLFYVQETGSLVSLKPHLCRREKLKSYLFLLVLDGQGTVTSGGKEQLLSRGQGAFLDCMIPYSHISSESQPWRLAWVHFAGRSLPGYYAYFQNVHPTPFLTLPEPERHEAILSQLLSLTKEPGAGAELQVSDLLHRLVTLLITGSNTAPREQDKLEQVRKYLDEHYAEDITLDSLAQTFYLSRFYLSRSFSERFHMTLKEYLLGRRITAAKALLRFTALPIQEVARTCGIPDANYFSKVFQKLEGVTPTAFRKQW